MKHRLPPLDALKAFEAAARHLSFSLAADELCITKGAVSYQVRKLESHLQCSLFRRSVRQVYLTDAGQLLLHTTQQLFADLGDALLQLQGDSEQSGVSVAATTYVAARWLSARISAFNEAHPQVSVLLQHSVNSADFKLTDVDLAIRWGPCQRRGDRNRIAEMPMPLYPAISPGLLRKHGLPDAPLQAAQLLQSPLCNLPLLGEDRHQDLWQEWLQSSGHRGTLPNPRRLITDANVRVQAAIDGQGLTLADPLMLNELNSAQLVAPFRETLEGYGYALLCSPNRILNDNAQALKHWITAEFSA
jgi:LysR family glycine cleavage system transcriptional activator